MEARAVFVALFAFMVMLISDSAPIITRISKQRDMIFLLLMIFLEQIIPWTERHHVKMIARFIIGRENVIKMSLVARVK